MTIEQRIVNPHPVPGADRLTRIDDHILGDAITLRLAGDVPASQLHLAGVPSLAVLAAERRRRDAARFRAAS